jgi:hypothetical protein
MYTIRDMFDLEKLRKASAAVFGDPDLTEPVEISARMTGRILVKTH